MAHGCDNVNEYYDAALRGCMPCAEICHAEYFREACAEYCPRYTTAVTIMDTDQSTSPTEEYHNNIIAIDEKGHIGTLEVVIVTLLLLCASIHFVRYLFKKCSKDHEKDKPTQDIHIELQPIQQPRTVENDIPPFESEDKLSTRHGGPPTSPGPPSVLRQ